MHVVISGSAQGVLFRDWTRQQAQSLGLTGWVKNTPNGQVEAVFEGPKEKVGKMVKKCQQGPTAAKVEKVEVKWEETTGEFVSFEIRYG